MSMKGGALVVTSDFSAINSKILQKCESVCESVKSTCDLWSQIVHMKTDSHKKRKDYMPFRFF